MARKPRMGRNLNALLNSAVKERREQDETAEAPPERRATEASGETAADEHTASRERAAIGSASGAVDLAVVRLPSGGEGRGRDGAGHREGNREADELADGAAPDERGARDAAGASAQRMAERRSDGADDESRRAPADETRDGRGDGEAPADDGAGATARTVSGAEAHVTRVMASARTEPAPAGGEDADASGDPPRPGDRLRMIGVERIRRGVFQPRRFFDQEALQELADSLRAQGMIQPVVVRPIGDVFELIAGERRWRAAQIAGLAEIPAIVREMEDRSVAAVSLIENIQREDLNPLEEAQALMRLCDEFGMTHASVAESIGRSRAAVSNLMRLLELHDDVKAMVDKGELDMGHARALLRVPTADQPALAARVAKQGLTVRAVEKLIRTGTEKTAPDAAPETGAALDPDVERLVERLSGVLGAPVSIRHKPGGAGKLEIRYGSLDELDGILAHIR